MEVASGRIYTSASTYCMLFQGAIRIAYANATWKCWVPLACRLFMWLAMQYKIWTSDSRCKHGLQDVPSPCFLCDQDDDNVDHNLLDCVYSPQVWHLAFSRMRINLDLLPMMLDRIQPWWLAVRKRIPTKHRKGFDVVVMLKCWNLWKQRNARVFGNQASVCSAIDSASRIAYEMNLWSMAGWRGASDFSV